MHVDVTIHDNPDTGASPLITIRGKTLTVDEAHALVIGCVGLLYGLSTSASQSIDREPHYFIGALILSYLIGRHVRTSASGSASPS